MEKRLMMLIVFVFSLVFSASSSWATRVTLKYQEGETASARDTRAAKAAAASGMVDGEVIVTVVDESGKPMRTKQGRNVIENSISFTYNSPEYPWDAETLSQISAFMDKANSAAKAVYGPPAFNMTINVRYNPNLYQQFGAIALYDTMANEIVIGSTVQMDMLVHELLHSFRDDLVIGNLVYEEGMTRAAEVKVMAMLGIPNYWDAHHSYVYDVKYAQNNVPAIASLYGSFYRGFPNLLRKYQQAGYVWGKILVENPDFFKKFNKLYYGLAINDPTLPDNTPALKNLVAKYVKNVEGKAFSAWYTEQHILNIFPTDGVQIMYTETYDDAYLFIFNRYNGLERTIGNAVVTWEVYDCSGTNLLNGVGVADANGIFTIPFWQQIAQMQYTGRVNLVFNVQTPEGNIRKEQSALTPIWPEGLYGVTPVCSGDVSISGPAGNVTVKAVNGFFQHLPSGNVAGTFKVQSGSSLKIVTKDAAAYYVPF